MIDLHVSTDHVLGSSDIKSKYFGVHNEYLNNEVRDLAYLMLLEGPRQKRMFVGKGNPKEGQCGKTKIEKKFRTRTDTFDHELLRCGDLRLRVRMLQVRWDVEKLFGRGSNHCFVRVSLGVSFCKKTVWKGKVRRLRSEHRMETFDLLYGAIIMPSFLLDAYLSIVDRTDVSFSILTRENRTRNIR